MKRVINARTLRRLANVPQMKIKIFEVILQKPFSRAINFVCSRMQLRMLQEIDAAITFVGLNPKSSPHLKIKESEKILNKIFIVMILIPNSIRKRLASCIRIFLH